MTSTAPMRVTWRASLARAQGEVADLADRVRALHGFARLAAAMASGALSVLSFAPVYFVPVLGLTLPVLVWLMDGVAAAPGAGPRAVRTAARPAFVVGWGFGFGFFLAGLYWIGNAFLVDSDTFGWMIPFVAVLLPGALALFPALALAAVCFVWAPGWPRIALFAVAFAANEYLRGHVLTGFPWNLMGYAWGSTLPVLQLAALIGAYGLSFLTVLGAASFALIGDRTGGHTRLLPLAALVFFALVGVWGLVRLDTHPPAATPGVRLRLVHAALDQRDIENPALRGAIFAHYIALSERAGLPSRTIVIWPEAAVPFVLSREPKALSAIGDMLPPKTVLITGAPRLENAPDSTDYKVFNSLHAIDSAGRIIATYDKTHLVPFGEYLPLAPLLERIGLAQLAGSLGGFSPGSGLRTLSVPDAPAFGPLICYEVIFPGDVTEAGVRPFWLVNVTDDSWFGSGAGPRQHFDSARMRAIEEGLPLVRVANKGFSAIVDPFGRIVAKSGLDDVGVLDGDLPQFKSRAFYGRFGDVAAGFLVASVLGLGLAFRSKTATDYHLDLRRGAGHPISSSPPLTLTKSTT